MWGKKLVSYNEIHSLHYFQDKKLQKEDFKIPDMFISLLTSHFDKHFNVVKHWPRKHEKQSKAPHHKRTQQRARPGPATLSSVRSSGEQAACPLCSLSPGAHEGSRAMATCDTHHGLPSCTKDPLESLRYDTPSLSPPDFPERALGRWQEAAEQKTGCRPLSTRSSTMDDTGPCQVLLQLTFQCEPCHSGSDPA